MNEDLCTYVLTAIIFKTRKLEVMVPKVGLWHPQEYRDSTFREFNWRFTLINLRGKPAISIFDKLSPLIQILPIFFHRRESVLRYDNKAFFNWSGLAHMVSGLIFEL